MEYIRWAKAPVEKALSTRRVIIISGERQAGKTTLTKQALPKNSTYRTLDDTMLFSIAKDSPAYSISKYDFISEICGKSPFSLTYLYYIFS